MKAAIVGVGAMGRWFANFAKDQGWEVVVTDINFVNAERVAEELKIKAVKSQADAVKDADIVIVAVPIAKTPGAITDIAPSVKKGALLTDVASVKSEGVDAMKALKVELELVSVHPLFGPGATSVKEKDFVMVPVKPGQVYADLKALLTKLGANVVEMGAEEHDRLMAIAQALTHFVLISYLSALKSMRGTKNAEKLRLPMFSTLLNLGKAFLSGNPELYGEIQVFNKYARISRSAIIEAYRSLDIAFEAGDAKAATKIFEKGRTLWTREEAEAAYKNLYGYFEGGKK